MDSAFEKFRDHVTRNSLVATGDRVLLAVSAGKDSVAMLYMMQELKELVDFETGVFHLNHMTRGVDSDADAGFVEETACGMGLFCRVCSVDVNAERPGGVSFEEFARGTRYRLLAETAGEHGYNKIATAHNSDDNYETVLMRLLSGTGIRGLRGIPAARGEIIRPMLCCSALEIYEYLKLNGYAWREDASNRDERYLRNFVRNRLSPVISERFPDARSALNNLARVSAEQVNLIDNTLEAAYPGYIRDRDNSVVISHPGLNGNLAAIRYIISRELGERFGIKVSSSVLDEITRNYSQVRANNILYESDGITIRKRESGTGGELVISPAAAAGAVEYWEYSVDINSTCETVITGQGIVITAMDSDYESFCDSRADAHSVFLSVRRSLGSIIVRSRVPGDRIRLGFGTRKIKDLMIEKKLDTGMKNSIPIITVDGEVAACLFGILPGSLNRISCNFLVCNDSERIIRINIKADHDI